MNGMRDKKRPAVYVLTSRKYGPLYIGVTSALWNRVSTHKAAGIKGFTERYNIHQLVWYENHQMMDAAIRREKQLKKWNRAWKIELIEKFNPSWRDLHDEIDFDHTLVQSENEGFENEQKPTKGP